jgi:hypothetical protein
MPADLESGLNPLFEHHHPDERRNAKVVEIVS